MTQLDVVDTPPAIHGEGPVWDAQAARLLWVDVFGGRVRSHTPEHPKDAHWQLEQDVGCVAPLRGGGVIVGVRDGFGVVTSDGEYLSIASPLASEPHVRMNDGACDPDGRFWAGSMADDATPGAGSLFRLEADGHVSTVLPHVTISNGLAWTPDGDHLYYIDSATQCVDRFTYERSTGAISDRRTVVRVPADQGEPDGLTVDADGCLWVAIWNGGAVHRYAPDGRLLSKLQLPVPLVTSCAFGGNELTQLYITTSTFAMTASDLQTYPLAGSLFVAEPRVNGLSTPPCSYEPSPRSAPQPSGGAPKSNPSTAIGDTA